LMDPLSASSTWGGGSGGRGGWVFGGGGGGGCFARNTVSTRGDGREGREEWVGAGQTGQVQGVVQGMEGRVRVQGAFRDRELVHSVPAGHPCWCVQPCWVQG
jgi:hypothetical protein